MIQKNQFKTEKEIYHFWENQNLFAAQPMSKKIPYSLLIPPPNLTGELHLGHAMQHSILDAIARFKRLQGFDVLLLPGVDHAGIQFEATLNKELEKENLTKEKLGREEWLKKAWEFKEKVYQSVSATWRFMGLSADWSREVFTLDPKPQRAVYEQFKRYYNAGLIYKGPYIVQWCPKCQTAIEDVEVEYQEKEDELYYIKYPIKNQQSKFITIATVRPETMFADVAVVVNPSDKRYQNLIGQTVIVPFVNREVSVIGDEAVDPKFGSGVLKIDPAHDLLDFEIGKKHQLETIAVIDKSGRLNQKAGMFAGKRSQEVRRLICEELSRQDLVAKIEKLKHNVSICERCKTPTELLISEEWFVKVAKMAKEAIKVIKAGEIKFFPKNYAKILSDWLANAHDWCISRSLWWGHRIPAWYKGDQKRVAAQSPGEGWVQDEQVLDAWFSSGLWPLSTLGWSFGSAQDKPSNKNPEFNPELAKYYPWDFEISAPEIKYLWIARMIMIGTYFTGKAPFKTMFFHGMIRDLLGRKFSKSLGNGIEPTYLIEKWGVDATRMALYSYSIPGRDGRVSQEILDERGKNFRNFATKVRNIARYVLELKPKSTHLGGVHLATSEVLRSDSSEVKHEDDKWILAELKKTIRKVTSHLEKIELHLATDGVYNFIWHQFAEVYIEKSKKRRAEAQPVLEYVLKNCLMLLHPFMPFLTEEIYQKFEEKKKSIMLESWPQ